MKKTLPNITYNLSNPGNEMYRYIEINGEPIHWIEDPDKFYAIFGFTRDMRQAGMLPEEFIWGEYRNNRKFDFTACMQTQIIKYLRVHSHKFLQKYGNQCEQWLAALAHMRPSTESVCPACKMNPVCSN